MATIKDIAKEAGVSISTVSYVINDSGPVGDEKKKLILELVEKYKFQPNRIAKSLKEKKTRTIGILTDLTRFDIGKQIIIGISEMCKQRNYNVLMSNQMEDLKKSFDILVSSQVEGIIYLDYRVEEFAVEFDVDIPMVFAYCYNSSFQSSCVIPDDVQGGYIATNHLIERGHKRIGCITGYVNWKATNDRIKGYQTALNEKELYIDPTLIRVGDYRDMEKNYKIAYELLSSEDRPTAIFALNDVIAAGVYNAAYDLGFRIPQDVAVVGFDNRDFANYIRPSLTTVSMPLMDIGKNSCEILFDKIGGKFNGDKNTKPLTCNLVVRHSS